MSQIQNSGFNTIAAIDQWMKTISANVTGATVTGYKGQTVEFGQVLESMTAGAIKPTDGYGSVDPISNPDSGITITSTQTDFSQGTIQGTSEKGNLAINGDAFFVLSKVPVPRTMDDVVFSRNGDFHWEFLPGSLKGDDGKPLPGVGTFRLVNSDGYFVQGYNSPIIDGIRPPGLHPEESKGTDLANLSTITVPDAPGQSPKQVKLQGLQLDLARNPDATNNIQFNSAGQIQVAGDDPRDLANNKANMFVSLVKFANQDGLKREGGGPYFQYDVVAGEMFAGTAGDGTTTGTDRVVGATNTLTPGAIENSNTSINTTMPQITLAQKSFTAATKIVSVGNSMIDDANQLVK